MESYERRPLPQVRSSDFVHPDTLSPSRQHASRYEASPPSVAHLSMEQNDGEYRMKLQNLLHRLDSELKQRIFVPGHDIRHHEWIECARRFEVTITQRLKPVAVPDLGKKPANGTTQSRSSVPTTDNFENLPIEIDDTDNEEDSSQGSHGKKRARGRRTDLEDSPTKRARRDADAADVSPPIKTEPGTKVFVPPPKAPRCVPLKLRMVDIRTAHRKICPTFNDNVEIDRRIVPVLFKPATEFWESYTRLLLTQTLSILERDMKKVLELVFEEYVDSGLREVVWGEMRATLAELAREELRHAAHHLEVEREVHFYRRGRAQLQAAEGDELNRLRELFNRAVGAGMTNGSAAGPGPSNTAGKRGSNAAAVGQGQQSTPADHYNFELTIMSKLGVYYLTAAYRYLDAVILSINGGMFVKCLPLIHQRLQKELDFKGPDGERQCRDLMIGPPRSASLKAESKRLGARYRTATVMAEGDDDDGDSMDRMEGVRGGEFLAAMGSLEGKSQESARSD